MCEWVGAINSEVIAVVSKVGHPLSIQTISASFNKMIMQFRQDLYESSSLGLPQATILHKPQAKALSSPVECHIPYLTMGWRASTNHGR